MSINTEIHIIKSMVSSTRLIQTETFYPKQLAADLSAWNMKRTELLSAVSEQGKEASALLDEATSGTCSRPAGVAAELSKLSAKLPRYRIELISLICDKCPLQAPINAAFKAEGDRWAKIEAKRNAQLDEITKDMEKPIKHGVCLSDKTRRVAADNRGRCHHLANNTRTILTDEEADILQDLQTSFQDLF